MELLILGYGIAYFQAEFYRVTWADVKPLKAKGRNYYMDRNYYYRGRNYYIHAKCNAIKIMKKK